MSKGQDRRKKTAEDRINEAMKKLKLAGIAVRSYTVYPRKGMIKANVTIEVKE
jgi:hypothetical protein